MTHPSWSKAFSSGAAAKPSPMLASTHPSWLDRDAYPFEARCFETEQGTLHYLDEGQGRPILFVHGTPSWSFEWRHAIFRLRTERRCIAPDHLGFGLSAKPPTADYRPEHHARRLAELVRHLDLRDLTLVVHDFGGPIGLPLALESSRVREVVVVNSWMWPLDHDPRVARISSFVRSPLGRFLYLWLNASPRWLLPLTFADRRRLPRSVHRQYTRPFARPAMRIAPWTLGGELAGSEQFYRSLWNRRASLSRLPLTLIWGLADPTFDVTVLRRWQEGFPHALTIALPEIGHFPQEEAPEAFVGALWQAANAASQ